MSNNLRAQVYNNLNMKESDELLDIWRINNRAEWSDMTFELIEEILKNRGFEIPPQLEPDDEIAEEESKTDNFDFSELELKIIDDENPPVFYDPLDVLITSRQIETIAKVMIGLVVIYNLANYSSFFRIIQGYFINNPYSTAVYIITFLLVAVNTAIGILTIYFPLLALARILKILMEMEFNSRKVTT